MQPISLSTSSIPYRKPLFKQNQQEKSETINSQKLNAYEEEKLRLMKTGVLSTGCFLFIISLAQGFSMLVKRAEFLGKSQKNSKAKRNMQEFKKIVFEQIKNNEKIPKLSECFSLDKNLERLLISQKRIKNGETELINELNLKPKNRILLCGKPGSGKTFFSKIFAKELDAKYAEIKYADINSKWIGEAIEKMDYIFKDSIKVAQENKDNLYVITINEIDSIIQPVEHLAGMTHSAHALTKMEQRANFLEYLDEMAEKAPNIVIIGTTNILPKSKNLDSATLSRFQEIIELGLPKADAIYEALIADFKASHYTKALVEKEQSALKSLTKTLEEKGASFRDLQKVINDSKEEFLDTALKNNDKEFKIEFLNKAIENLNITDGSL